MNPPSSRLDGAGGPITPKRGIAEEEPAVRTSPMPGPAARTGGRRRGTRFWAVLVFLLFIDALVVGAVVMSITRRATTEPAPLAWSSLDPTARCAQAIDLISQRPQWPIVCRWRAVGETTSGESFPPPAGDPPWDRPRIEVHLDAGQGREELARVIAHEMGHMHHTREPSFVPDWLKARNLAPDTDWTLWVEDYAEIFARIFGPPSPDWRAPTVPPTAAELASLRARFFE